MTLTRVNTNGITDGAVGTTDLADGAVTEGKLGAAAVTTNKVADGAVTTGKVADGAVTEGKLGASAVTTGKIADSSITTAKIAAGAVVTADLADAAVTTAKLAFDGGALTTRNRIINGDMRIDQRNAGATITGGNGGYSVDRWLNAFASAGKFNYGRSAVAPAGFTNSLLHTVAAAHTAAAGDFMLLQHYIEGFNVADLSFGTASAAPVTVSFWVRSSVTGTYSVAITNGSDNRAYVTTYAISAANTWEYKSVTIPGDTTGTWATDNGKGLSVKFDLGSGSNFVAASTNSWVATNTFKASGSVSLCATNGATFYLTGVQLEAGSVATPFERRHYGQELALCQRYYYRTIDAQSNTALMIGGVENVSSAVVSMRHPVDMRATPTITLGSGIRFYSAATSGITPTIGGNRSTIQLAAFQLAISGGTAGQAGYIYNATNSNSYIEVAIEL
jgi:hypothetical protein